MGTKCRGYTDILAAHPEVTGSNFLLVAKMPNGEKVKIVVDCGLFQEREYEKYNSSLIFEPQTIDYAFLTHSHVDHCGRLPFMVANGYENKIFCSEDTKKILYLALKDNFEIQKKQWQRSNQKNLYTNSDVIRTYDCLVGSEFNKWYFLNQNVKFMLLSNGHLQGSAMIVISFYDYCGDIVNFLFTGDYSPRNTFFQVQDIPREILWMPLNIVIEATYGDTSSVKDNSEEVFVNNMIEALKAKKVCVVLTYSLGRAQEMLFNFKVMQEQGILTTNIPIFFDGLLAQRYTELFKKGYFNIVDSMKDFLPRNIHFVTTPEMRLSLLNSKKSKIILTTSGMGSYGPAQTYLPFYINEPRALIHFTGYCAEGTYGRMLQNTQNGETFFSNSGGVISVKEAIVKYTTEFSKHARSNELLDFLKRFNCVNSVIVNHGSTKTKQEFARRVYKELGIRKIGIINRDVGFRVNGYGIEREISTVR